MTDTSVTYMGIPLKNPIIVGACSQSKSIDQIKAFEDAGAGALVIKSLFEEQIQLESSAFDSRNSSNDNTFAEALSMFPKLEHGGAKEHVYWVKKARAAVKMPLIASLNCINPETWLQYAKELEATGVDALELNFYSPTLSSNTNGSDIEKHELETMARVASSVKIPVSIKLHPFYTNLMNFAKHADVTGIHGIVLFNRLFQPDININQQKKLGKIHLSSPQDNLLPLRWSALLSTRLHANIIASSGIYTGEDVVKMILSGAQAVQVVSALYTNGSGYIQTMLKELTTWMQVHNHKTLDSFRGNIAKERAEDPWTFERGQYIKAILGFD